MSGDYDYLLVDLYVNGIRLDRAVGPTRSGVAQHCFVFLDHSQVTGDTRAYYDFYDAAYHFERSMEIHTVGIGFRRRSLENPDVYDNVHVYSGAVPEGFARPDPVYYGVVLANLHFTTKRSLPGYDPHPEQQLYHEGQMIQTPQSMRSTAMEFFLDSENGTFDPVTGILSVDTKRCGLQDVMKVALKTLSLRVDKDAPEFVRWADQGANTAVVEVTQTPGATLPSDSLAVFLERRKLERVGPKLKDDGSYPIDLSRVGTTEVEFQYIDRAGNASETVTRTYTVQDTTPPVFVEWSDGDGDEVVLEVSQMITNLRLEATALDALTAKFTDNEDPLERYVGSKTTDGKYGGTYAIGDIDNKSVRKIALDFTYADTSGNSTTVTRTYNIKDTIPPVLDTYDTTDQLWLPKENAIEIHHNSTGYTVSPPDALFNDNSVVGNLPAVNPSIAQIDVSEKKQHDVVYDGTDASGNTTSVTRSVTVTDQFCRWSDLKTGAESEVTHVEMSQIQKTYNVPSASFYDSFMDATDSVTPSVATLQIDAVDVHTIDYIKKYTHTDSSGTTIHTTRFARRTFDVKSTVAPDIVSWSLAYGTGIDNFEVTQAQTNTVDTPSVTLSHNTFTNGNVVLFPYKITDEDGNDVTDEAVMGSATTATTISLRAIKTRVLHYKYEVISGIDFEVTRTFNVVNTTPPVYERFSDGHTHPSDTDSTSASTEEVSQTGTYAVPKLILTDSGVVGDIEVDPVFDGDGSDPLDITKVGSFTATYTFTNSGGVSFVATRTYNVVDTTPPVFQEWVGLSSDYSPVVDGSGNYTTTINAVEGTSVDLPSAQFTDNSLANPVLVAPSQSSIDISSKKTYVFTYEYDDQHTPPTTVTHTFVVQDITAPIFVSWSDGESEQASEIVLEVSQTDTYTVPTATFRDNGTDYLIKAEEFKSDPYLDLKVKGEYTGTYIHKDSGDQKLELTRRFKVQDTTDPVFSRWSDGAQADGGGNYTTTIQVSQTPSKYTLPTAFFTDNSWVGQKEVYATLPGGQSNEVDITATNTYLIQYICTDDTNTTTVTRTFSVVDTEPPVFVDFDDGVNAATKISTNYWESNQEYEVGTAVSLPKARFRENSLGTQLEANGSLGFFWYNTVGEQIAEYQVTDMNGNVSALVRRKFVVVDTTDPVLDTTTPWSNASVSSTRNGYGKFTLTISGKIGELITLPKANFKDNSKGSSEGVFPYQYEGDGIYSSPTSLSGRSTWTQTSAGKVTFYYQYIDESGNESRVEKLEITFTA